MKKSSRIFFPKILLFGEYSVILGSQALTMPYDFYEGTLCLPSHASTNNAESSKELKTFFQYLKNSNQFSIYKKYFDWPRFQFELNQGLYFDSNIPQGYGVGSSGAVTASILDRYMDVDYLKGLKLQELKKCMSTMESHFHGKSSGLDPLVSYYNKPILCEKDDITFCELPKGTETGEIVLFLLDTGRSRRTEALVNLYIEKLKNPVFANSCNDELISYTHQCIKSFMKGDIESLFESFYRLSAFQCDEFSPMIPKVYMPKWKDGLRRKQTLLKLCGAGGGGFLLGLSRNFSELAQEWKNEQIKVLKRF